MAIFWACSFGFDSLHSDFKCSIG